MSYKPSVNNPETVEEKDSCHMDGDASVPPPAPEKPWWEGKFGRPGEIHAESNKRKLSEIGG
jgi:hypothetical protein